MTRMIRLAGAALTAALIGLSAACGGPSGPSVKGCTQALIAQYPHESHIPAACNGLTQAQQKQAAGKAAAYELNKAFGG